MGVRTGGCCREQSSVRRLFLQGVRDESGAYLLSFLLMMPVLLLFAGIAIDGARIYNLQMDGRRFADALSTAGARELNGMVDAVERAELAVSDAAARFNTSALAVTQMSFYRSLPSSDAVSPQAFDQTSIGEYARFIAVEVDSVGFSFSFAAPFLGTAATVTTRATAGNDEIFCNLTPLFMCLPASTWNNRAHRAGSGSDVRQFRLVRADRTGLVSYGTYGALEPVAATPGATVADPDLQAAIAAAEPAFCTSRLTSIPRMMSGSIAAAINTRFDLRQGVVGVTPAEAPPSENVRKGYEPDSGGDWCSGQPSALQATLALPRDECFATGSCETLYQGNGTWDLQPYWLATYGSGASQPANPKSRYQVHRLEVETGLVGIPGPTGETGAPQCTPAVASSYDRRLIRVLAVDCADAELSDYGRDLAVLDTIGHATLFLSEPVAEGGDEEMFVEIVDVAVAPAPPPLTRVENSELFR